MPIEILPRDEHNEALLSHVHPPDWKNPQPAGRYNLVAIGAGTAGLISAVGTAGLGGKSALIERHLMGGDCLNVGCVPSKGLIRAARAAHAVRTAKEFGYRLDDLGQVDFPAVMERMRRLRAGISPVDSAERFSREGVDVYFGEGRFTGPNSIEVAGQTLQFAKAVVATGGRAAAPPIDGLEATGYLTNETIFSLTELPRRLVVIGGGPIGSEMAQSFRRFGSEVYLVDRAPSILNKEDREPAAIVQQQFEREGIHVHTGCTTTRVEKTGDTRRVTITCADGSEQQIDCDAILVAVGRRPNVEGLDLEAAGIEYSPRGVTVNDYLQTTNKNVYAAGDICSKYQFTHAADAMSRIVLRNALFKGRGRMSALVIPRCTYTDPELAHVGLTERECEEAGIAIDSYRFDLDDVDRAILDGEDQGFAVVHCRKGKGEILGASIVAAHAGEMIGEITLLMTHKMGLGKLAEVIHCYPTQVEVLKRIADRYNKTRLTRTVAALFSKWLAWQR